MTQVRQNIRERSPKLGWQTLYLENKTKKIKQTKSKDKKNNEGCLPQVLSLMSSASLVTINPNKSDPPIELPLPLNSSTLRMVLLIVHLP
jgi:hypothetical protein